MIRTFIYGSCVARDTFEELRPLGYSLRHYVARQSIITATADVSARSAMPASDVSSSFQRRMIEGDWNANLLAELDMAAGQVDLLLWDLFDERLGVRRSGTGHVSTRSVDSLKAGMDAAMQGSTTLIPMGSSEHLELFAEALVRFRAELEDRDLLGRTLLVAPRWAEKTTCGDDAPGSFGWNPGSANETYQQYYRLVSDIVGVPVVDAPHEPLANPRHRWGPAPFHYDLRTYDRLAAEIHTFVLAQDMLRHDASEGDLSMPENLVPIAHGNAARSRALKFLEHGQVVHPKGDSVPYAAADMWSAKHGRSLARYLHGFLFLADWHATILPEHPGAVDALERAILDWLDRNAAPPGSHEMAFHDETTAQRVLQWCHVRDSYAHLLPPTTVERLDAALTDHVELLLDPQFYAGGNNHGMFQDLALLRVVTSQVPLVEAVRDRCQATALQRLDAYFSTCYTSDGVHNENSPAYHLMVSAYLGKLLPVVRQLQPEVAVRFNRIYAQAEAYATHVIMPDGYLPPISDTPPLQVRRSGHAETFRGSEYRYSVTGGREGSVPGSRTAVFPAAGYAVYRSAWGTPLADYVLFKAGYRANYHHHADDLSVLLYSRGRLLLTEAGPFGYEMSDPRTIYAFSQYAHNSIIVDGRSQSRVDSHPGGVELVQAVAERGQLDVTGINTRTKGTTHTRRLTVGAGSDGTRLDVHDVVEHVDGAVHRHEVRWHIDPEARVVLRNSGAELFVGSSKVLEMVWRADSPVQARLETGQLDPVRALHFPAFGRERQGAALVVSSATTQLNLQTSVRTGPTDFTVRDWGVGAASSTWRRHEGLVPINYLLEEVAGAKDLAVVFSAMAPPGSFASNYHRPLQDVHCHRLFILDDFAEQGAYYAALRRDRTVMRAVQDFLRKCAAGLGVPGERIHTIGSAKGGTAAVLHGIKLGVGHILAGAPQTLVGTFLLQPHPNVLTDIAGGTSADDVEWADRLLFRSLHGSLPAFDGEVDLMIGDKDHHFRNHLPSLQRALAGKNYLTRVLPNVTHSTFGRPFSVFVADEMSARCGRILAPEDDRWSVHIDSRDSSLRAWVAGRHPCADEYAFYLYDADGLVGKNPYSSGRAAQFRELRPGRYRVCAFRRAAGTTDTDAQTSNWIELSR